MILIQLKVIVIRPELILNPDWSAKSDSDPAKNDSDPAKSDSDQVWSDPDPA